MAYPSETHCMLLDFIHNFQETCTFAFALARCITIICILCLCCGFVVTVIMYVRHLAQCYLPCFCGCGWAKCYQLICISRASREATWPPFTCHHSLGRCVFLFFFLHIYFFSMRVDPNTQKLGRTNYEYYDYVVSLNFLCTFEKWKQIKITPFRQLFSFGNFNNIESRGQGKGFIFWASPIHTVCISIIADNCLEMAGNWQLVTGDWSMATGRNTCAASKCQINFHGYVYKVSHTHSHYVLYCTGTVQVRSGIQVPWGTTRWATFLCAAFIFIFNFACSFIWLCSYCGACC